MHPLLDRSIVRAVVIDVAPYFGHPEVDLALVDVFSPVEPERQYA